MLWRGSITIAKVFVPSGLDSGLCNKNWLIDMSTFKTIFAHHFMNETLKCSLILTALFPIVYKYLSNYANSINWCK